MAAVARAIATRRRWPPDSSDGMPVDVFLKPDEPEHLLDAAAHLIGRHVGFLVQAIADVSRRSANRTARFPGTACRCRRGRQQFGLVHVVDALAIDDDRCSIRSQQPEPSLSTTDFPVPLARAGCVMAPRGTLKLMSESDVLVERQRHVLELHRRRISGRHRQRRTVRRRQRSARGHGSRPEAHLLGFPAHSAPTVTCHPRLDVG